MYEIYVCLRDEKGVKDATVAKETGIGKSTFSDWKNGRSAPKGEKLKKIAEYFGVSTQYLLTGDPRYKYLPDIDTFMENLKTPDRIEEKQALEYSQKFIRLSPKDREEIMRIIDMKIEMSREKENERFA